MEAKIVRAPRTPEKQAVAQHLRRNMTPTEKRLWECLRANRLQGLAFRRQQILGGFIVDFYCRAARMVIECDGAVHLTQAEYDAERDAVIASHNLRVLRFTNDQIDYDLPTVLTEILQAAQSITCPPSAFPSITLP